MVAVTVVFGTLHGNCVDSYTRVGCCIRQQLESKLVYGDMGCLAYPMGAVTFALRLRRYIIRVGYSYSNNLLIDLSLVCNRR